jgi:hypothetical protein
MCVAAKGRLQGRAATLLLLLIDKFIFNSIGFAELHFVPVGCAELHFVSVRELTSFGCGLAFPFSSLSLCSKNFMFYRVVGCFLGLLVNVECTVS